MPNALNRSAVTATLIAALAAVPSAAHSAAAPTTPNVPGCELCPSSCIVSTSSGTYYQYGTITNAQKGDALLYKGIGIASMLGLNFLFSHVGLMTGSVNVQHNSASILALTNSYHLNAGLGSWQQVGRLISSLVNGFYGAASLDAAALYNMTPGIKPDPADGGSQFGSLDGTWRADLTLLQPIASRRADSARATDWMTGHQGYPYRIFGFMNQNSGASSGGGVCSGTIAIANNASARTASNVTQPHTLSNADTGMAVLNLQATLWQMVRWDVVSAMAPSILGTGARNDVASGIVDQVINCAIYLQPGGCSLMNNQYYAKARASAGQQSGTMLPQANAVSPDHLAFTGVSNAEWSYNGRSADTRWKSKIDAGAWQGGVLVDPSFSGGKWVTWTNTTGACSPGGGGPM